MNYQELVKDNIMKTIRIIICVIITHIFLLTSNLLAESSVWKVSKGDNYFYLGATVHLLAERDHPLPSEFSVAYKDSSKLFFETDLIAAQSPEFQSKLITAMTYNDDRSLVSDLDPAVYKKLEDFLAIRQIPIANFSKFQPWGASLMLVIIEYQRLGMKPEYGVDTYFHNLALEDSKEIQSLETPKEQLNHLLAMAEIDPDVGVDYTLRDLKRLPEFVDMIKANWRSGDMASFSKNAFVLQMMEEFPEVFKTLVTTRNNAWMEKLPSLVDDSEIEFVLVGAMHLTGEGGLLNQLTNQGFKVEKI
jgi:uncharacterized protein YbaP (TraB family)